MSAAKCISKATRYMVTLIRNSPSKKSGWSPAKNEGLVADQLAAGTPSSVSGEHPRRAIIKTAKAKANEKAIVETKLSKSRAGKVLPPTPASPEAQSSAILDHALCTPNHALSELTEDDLPNIAIILVEVQCTKGKGREQVCSDSDSQSYEKAKSEGSEAASDDEASIVDVSGAQLAIEHTSNCSTLSSVAGAADGPGQVEESQVEEAQVEEDDGMTIMSSLCQDPLLTQTYFLPCV
ncbi:hypothetical protein L208DRAFT_1382988 [Tricholoma matsutake]|nr:hypothetical protein L208DRAFT_1382988 [Tricholoma matsutake 945]